MSPARDGRLILASASAARRRLLHDAGIVFECRPAQVDEAALKTQARRAGRTADATALHLAVAKARAVQEAGAVVIGADQMLSCGGDWFDKPADADQAAAQLRRLRGRTHQLHSAVVCLRDGVVLWRHVEQPALTMRAFSDAFLAWYLRIEAARLAGCVGGYRLEGPGVQLFADVRGEHSAVLGLPLLPLLAALRDLGVLPG